MIFHASEQLCVQGSDELNSRDDFSEQSLSLVKKRSVPAWAADATVVREEFSGFGACGVGNVRFAAGCRASLGLDVRVCPSPHNLTES
jgi:hypothetical protein